METRVIQSFETDSLSVRVPITVEPGGGPLDLSGASVEAAAERHEGLPVTAACTIEDAANGIVRVQVSPASFERELYVLQLRVTIGSEVQTVLSETIRARKSVKA